jgi:autotransporter-associated beta strand protein
VPVYPGFHTKPLIPNKLILKARPDRPMVDLDGTPVLQKPHKPESKMKSKTQNPFLLAAITLTLTAPAVLAGQIWDGGGGNDNWNLPANWDADSLPDFNSAISFEGANRPTPFNDLTAGTVVGGINFTNDGSIGKTSAFNLSGAGITLGGDITTTAASSLIADTSALDMILNADRTITTNTDHNLTISGIISEDVSLRALTKLGGGTLALSGDNSYTGRTSVNGGTLSVTNRTSASGYITVGTAGSGATVLNLGAGNNFTFSATTTSRIDVGGDAGATAPDSGAVNHSAGDITFVSGGGNQLLVGFLGTGTYNLSGGTLTTTTSTSAGVTLGVRDGTTATFNLSGTGSLQMETGSFLQIGRFTTNNSGNNATTLFNQTGGVANVGILSIGGVNTGTNRGKGGTHTLTVTDGIFTANTFPRLSAADNNTAIINIGGTADVTLPNFPTVRGAGATATLNLDGGILRNSATGTFITGLTNAYIQDGGATFNTSLNSTTISQNLLEDPGSTGGGLTKQGANTLTLSGTNTYTGDTTVSAGVLLTTSAAALPGYTTSGKVIFAGGTIAARVGGAGWTDGEVDALLVNATQTSGALGIDTTDGDFTLTTTNIDTTLGLTKLGPNILTLNQANIYTGNTTVSAGTLRLENTGAVAGSPLVAISGNQLEIATDSAFSGPNLSMQAGTIVSDRATPGAGLTHVLGNATIGNGVNNFTAGANVTGGTAAIQLGNISNNNGSVATPRLNPTTANLIITGGVTLGTSNAGTANLVLDGTGSVNSIAGAIANGTRVTGNVIKSGTSTWTLSGPNTYTGDTTVNDGVLAVTGTSIPNTGKLLINGSGIVNLTGTETVAALDFDGTPQPLGDYSATSVPPLATITTASFSGGGTLTVGSVAGFSAWQLANGTAGTIDQDHDNDGVDNGVEFFIYGPVANSGFTALPGVDNTGGTLSVTWTKAAGYTGAYNTDYVVETSTTLTGPWTPAVEGASPGQVLITGNDVKYTFPAGTKNFARLKVTGP